MTKLESLIKDINRLRHENTKTALLTILENGDLTAMLSMVVGMLMYVPATDSERQVLLDIRNTLI